MWEQLDSMMQEVRRSEILVVAGDVNGQVGNTEQNVGTTLRSWSRSVK